jgi:hypothetical protein
VTEVPETPPLRVEPLANGKSIPAEEFEEWSIQVVDQPSGLDLAVGRDSASSTWTMRPTLRWGYPQLTSTGSFPVTIRVSSPRRNEDSIQRKVQFNVREVSFWTLWGGLLLAALALLLLLIYMYGILTKPRFPRGSQVVYEEDEFKQRYPLPTTTLRRWLVPFVAEETETGFNPRLRLRASKGSAIYLPKGQQEEFMRIGARRLTNPGQTDEPIPPSTTVTYEADGRECKYTYKTG